MIELLDLLPVSDLVLAASENEFGPLAYIVTGLFTVVGMWAGYDQLRKKRVMENVPTSKVGGVTIGLNELKGEALVDEPIIAPFSGEECIYYEYSITERRKDSDGDSKTVTIESDRVSCDQFHLRDDTGKIRVRPPQMEVLGNDVQLVDFIGEEVVDEYLRPDDPNFQSYHHAVGATTRRRKRHFTEQVIRRGDDIYVLGPVQLREDVVEPEVAVETEEFNNDVDFIIANKTEKALVRSHFWWSVGGYLIALVTALILGAFGLVEQMGMPMEPTLMSIGGGWAALIALAYVKLLYDGLVEVRHRKERAFAMLDVEYKRRSDLIPRLVDVVSAAAEHESELQESLAEARSAANSSDLNETDAGPAIQRQTEALDTVFARVEDYPDLKSDQTFSRLIDQLTECEDKIALARQFYNSSVEVLNNRVHTVPDRFLAPLANAKEGEYLEFDSFEKKPVDIDLDRGGDDEKSEDEGEPAPLSGELPRR